MALKIDERARGEIVRRQRKGRDATLQVRAVRVGLQVYLTAGWAQTRGEAESMAPRLDGVPIRMDARVAAFVRQHTLTVTAWRWGPFGRLVVAEEPLVALQLQEWERRVWIRTGTLPARLGQW